MSDDKTIEQIAVSLVRAHYDDGMAFRDCANELAMHFDADGRYQLAEYVMAQYSDACTLSTMEVDPLPNIARDMFGAIEATLGKDHPKVREFAERLAQYMPDFCGKVREWL